LAFDRVWRRGSNVFHDEEDLSERMKEFQIPVFVFRVMNAVRIIVIRRQGSTSEWMRMRSEG
jgi:hypothetical protein